jgi:hypothetical protein
MLEERVAALEQEVIALGQDVAVISAGAGSDLMDAQHHAIGGVLALLIEAFFG